MIFPENWKDKIKYRTDIPLAVMASDRDELQDVLEFATQFGRKPLCLSEGQEDYYTVILG